MIIAYMSDTCYNQRYYFLFTITLKQDIKDKINNSLSWKYSVILKFFAPAGVNPWIYRNSSCLVNYLEIHY